MNVLRLAVSRILDTVRARRRALGATFALAVLVLAGSLAVLAAPHGHTPPPANATQIVDKGSTQTATDTETATETPTPTPTPTPHPKPHPTPPPVPPTATPVPPTATPKPPTPTPTPATPGWHTVGTYSGSTTGTLVILHSVTGNVRETWSCTLQPDQTPSTAVQVSFSIMPVNTPGGAGGSAWGLGCMPANCTVTGVTCTATTMSGVQVTDPTGGQWVGYDWTVSSLCHAPYIVTIAVWS